MSVLRRLFGTVRPQQPPLVAHVPVAPPCRGWLQHNKGMCGCYENYPREREARRKRDRH